MKGGGGAEMLETLFLFLYLQIIYDSLMLPSNVRHWVLHIIFCLCFNDLKCSCCRFQTWSEQFSQLMYTCLLRDNTVLSREWHNALIRSNLKMFLSRRQLITPRGFPNSQHMNWPQIQAQTHTCLVLIHQRYVDIFKQPLRSSRRCSATLISHEGW